jgi:hypothetical protein
MSEEQEFRGLDEAREKVGEFIKKAVQGMEGEGELRVSLHQTTKSGDMEVYETVHAFDETLTELLDELFEAACLDAKEIGRGRIKYSVKAEGVKGRTTFSLILPERPVGGSEDDYDDIDDLPNKRGLITQQMRHNEVFMKVAVNAQKESVETLKHMLREQTHRVAVLEKERMETFKAYEELLSMKQVRDIEYTRFQQSERRKDQVGSILMQGLPIVASKLLGGGAAQAKAMGAKAPLEMMLEGFLMTMNQEQLAKIASTDLLTAPQKAAFMEMIGFILERQAEEERLRTQGLNGQQKPQEEKRDT